MVPSLSKKDVVSRDILVREPETPDSDLEILAHEPEVVEARDPSPGAARAAFKGVPRPPLSPPL